jgi:hypothetical protein
MKMVVDSNYLNNEKLRSYLSASTHNCAVLTDYAAMEAYKGNTLASIYSSMAIVSDYPMQVIVLKPTSIVCGLTGREAASPKALIDLPSTREFPKYCRDLLAAQRGDLQLQQQLLQHGREATSHLERWLQDMQMMSSSIYQMTEWIKKIHSPAELKILRRREPYTLEMRAKLTQNVLTFAKEFFHQYPAVARSLALPEIRDTFIFRNVLCTYVLILKAVESGGVIKNPEKLRNTMIDVNFATFSAYFDGIMTADKLAQEVYERAEFLLRETFARPPFWLAWILRLFRRPLP